MVRFDDTYLKKIIGKHYDNEINSIERFKTGLCNYVYKVSMNDKNVVLKITTPEKRNFIKGGCCWYEQLKPLGIPLPELYCKDTEHNTPYMIMEYIDGIDLGQVYAELNHDQKSAIAKAVQDIQDTVSYLRPAEGFGFACSYEDPDLQEYTDWKKVILKSISGARKNINKNRLFDSKHADILLSQLGRFDTYFSRIRPLPFLDDLTTKNVLIKDGKLAGIVDVDNICFGDKLFNLALTRMALLADQQDTEYSELIADLYGLDEEEKLVLDFYTACHCLSFMGEAGQIYNGLNTRIDKRYNKHLENIFESLIHNENKMKTDLSRYGESCDIFVNEKLITDVTRVVKRGKEAVVLCCDAHSSMNHKYLAAKIYFQREFRSFKKEKIYHIGRVWDTRLLRAEEKKSGFGKISTRTTWVSNEFDTLSRLYDIGANVPEPIACTHDAVIMGFIGYGAKAAPLLKDVHLDYEDAELLFKKLMDNIHIMLSNNIVHADLSPFNIMYKDGEPYIIDFPQCVDPDVNPHAWMMHKRDIKNISDYFARSGLEIDHDQLAKETWEMYFGPVME